MKKTTKRRGLKKGKGSMRYSAEDSSRLNVYAAIGSEGNRAIEWAQKRWRLWKCGEHEQPRSASTMVLDLLIHAMRADAKKPRN